MRELYIYSQESAHAKLVDAFKKCFNSEGDPHIDAGDIVPPACITGNWRDHKLKQGEVTHVLEVNGVWQIWIQTSTPPNALQACLQEAGWEKIAVPLPY